MSIKGIRGESGTHSIVTGLGRDLQLGRYLLGKDKGTRLSTVEEVGRDKQVEGRTQGSAIVRRKE